MGWGGPKNVESRGGKSRLFICLPSATRECFFSLPPAQKQCRAVPSEVLLPPPSQPLKFRVQTARAVSGPHAAAFNGGAGAENGKGK